MASFRKVSGFVLLAATQFAGSGLALASHPVTTIHGHEFVTVGAPGNAPALLPVANNMGVIIEVGAVQSSFRVTRNEVTRGQWLGFIDAYRPHLQPQDYNDPQFSGFAAQYAGVGPDGLPGFIDLAPQFRDRPVTPSWTYIARFMNWMHNGAKPIHEATFEDFHSGAYNMNDYGSSTPVIRQEGAQFFMMNYDEWTKAVYYDPNRHGEGEGGYWRYPDGSDTPLVQGAPPPEGTGETSGGWGWNTGGLDAPPPVGAYGVETPWGLLDASGGESEWVEDYAMNHPLWHTVTTRRPFVGSSVNTTGNGSAIYDEIGWLLGGLPNSSLHTFRIATVIPAPPAGAAYLILGGGAALTQTRRR